MSNERGQDRASSLPPGGEAELAARARGGDKASFAILVELVAPALMGFFAIRGLDPTSAEEATQETFYQAYRSIETYRPDSPFRSWVYGIAGNVFLHTTRKRRRDRHDETKENDAVVRNPDPSTGLMDEERRAAIRAALEALPDRMKLVIQLRFFEGKSCEEIAEVMGTTLDAVSPLIYRAKAALRQHLEGVVDVDSTQRQVGGGS